MKKLTALVVTAAMIFGFSCAPKRVSKNSVEKALKTLDIGEVISNSRESLIWHGELSKNKGNCYISIDFFGTYRKKHKYFVISDAQRISPYAIFDSGSRKLYLKNRVIKNVSIRNLIKYNPECQK